MHRVVSLFLLAGWLAVVGCSSEPEPAKTGGAAKELTIAVVPKGTMQIFWKSVHAGARKAEQDLAGVRVLWQGPIIEDERVAQINLVETFVQKRVDGIVLAPLDAKALVASVRAAGNVGIPVVIIDSDLADPEAYISFVATDNYKGGVLGAKRLAEVVGDRGKVVLLRYQVGSASTEDREKGFLDEMARHPNITVVSSDQYAGPTLETAMTAGQALLTKYGEDQLNGIFCPNESSAYGMLRALVITGRAGKVKYVGFDVNDGLLEAMAKGEIQGLVVQNPFKMGEEGVRTIVSHIRGQEVPKRIDTGVVLVTPENLSDPEINRLVHPPLK